MELQKLEKINAKSEIQLVRNQMRTIMEVSYRIPDSESWILMISKLKQTGRVL